MVSSRVPSRGRCRNNGLIASSKISLAGSKRTVSWVVTAADEADDARTVQFYIRSVDIHLRVLTEPRLATTQLSYIAYVRISFYTRSSHVRAQMRNIRARVGSKGHWVLSAAKTLRLARVSREWGLVGEYRPSPCPTAPPILSLRSILLWEPPEGMSIGQALESFLQKRLEILGGRSQGTWSVDCETLQSVPNLTGET